MKGRDVEIFDVEDPSSPDVLTQSSVSRRGTRPAIFVLALVAVAVIVVQLDRQDPTTEADPTPVDQSQVQSETPAPVGPSSRIFGNEAERLGLQRSEIAYQSVADSPEEFIVAARAGSEIVVVNSSEPTAQLIRLPISYSDQNSGAGASIALLSERLIVFEGGILRSLSVDGGSDELLADDVLGFEVAGETLWVAQSVEDRYPGSNVVLGYQIMSGDSVSDRTGYSIPDGARLVPQRDRLFVEYGGAVFVPSRGGLVPVGIGSVMAAGPNHLFIRVCSPGQQVVTMCSVSRIDLRDGSGEEVLMDSGLGSGQMAVSPDGTRLLQFGDRAQSIGLFEISDGQLSAGDTFDLAPAITAATFSADSSALVFASGDSIVLWGDGTSVIVLTVPGFSPIEELVFAE